METRHRAAPGQRGAALLVTLIVTALMVLGVLSFTRSADTANLIAGNTAFKQAATQAAELGLLAAGNDIVAFRERFGKQMAYTGGIDKRALAKGGAVMEAELKRVIPPLFKEGGYIPGCDHGVPPDISWPNFVEYARLLAQYTGWL